MPTFAVDLQAPPQKITSYPRGNGEPTVSYIYPDPETTPLLCPSMLIDAEDISDAEAEAHSMYPDWRITRCEQVGD